MAHKIEDIPLCNGHKMPVIALGTWEAGKDKIGQAVDAALEAGYRNIDSAYMNENESEIGQILKKWFDSGRLKREDVFIVSKLPFSGNRPESVEKYLKKSLAALQVDYLDLYLIHHPAGLREVEGVNFPMDKDGHVLLDLKTDHVSTWKAMEAQVDAGRVRALGMADFNSRQVKRVWQAARIKPAVLQVELHVYFQQRELVAFCQALDVVVSAYAPLGSPQIYALLPQWGHDSSKIPVLKPMSDPVVTKIAKKHNKLPAQVLLRHIIQRGLALASKSVTPERIRQNIDVFDFELTPEEVDQLDALDQGQKARIFNYGFAPDLVNHPEDPLKERY